jgi:hypothetical protein
LQQVWRREQIRKLKGNGFRKGEGKVKKRGERKEEEE